MQDQHPKLTPKILGRVTQPEPTDSIITKSNRKGIYRDKEQTNDFLVLGMGWRGYCEEAIGILGDKEFSTCGLEGEMYLHVLKTIKLYN